MFEKSQKQNILIIPRTISQNPCENLFRVIRMSNGSISNPNLVMVTATLNSIIRNNQFKIGLSKSANYSADWQPLGIAKARVICHAANKIQPHPIELVRTPISEEITAQASRIVNGVERRKKFTLIEGSQFLKQLVQWLFEHINLKNLHPYLPYSLNSLLIGRKREFEEQLEECHTQWRDSSHLYLSVCKFLTTVCLREFLIINQLIPKRGAKSLRNAVSSHLAESPQMIAVPVTAPPHTSDHQENGTNTAQTVSGPQVEWIFEHANCLQEYSLPIAPIRRWVEYSNS